MALFFGSIRVNYAIISGLFYGLDGLGGLNTYFYCGLGVFLSLYGAEIKKAPH